MPEKHNVNRAFWQAMWDGWANRCPKCRDGRIWNEGGGLNDRCAVCNLEFEHEKATWGAFMWAFLLEGILIAIGIPIVELFADLSFVQHVWLWVAFTLVFHVLFYKNMKGQWIGMRWALWDEMDERIK